MRFSLIVSTADRGHIAQQRALGFAQAVIDRGQTLAQVFFYADGVAAIDATPADRWQAIQAASGAELVLCSASVERLKMEHPPSGFTIAGLGALIEAGVTADRVISFV